MSGGGDGARGCPVSVARLFIWYNDLRQVLLGICLHPYCVLPPARILLRSAYSTPALPLSSRTCRRPSSRQTFCGQMGWESTWLFAVTRRPNWSRCRMYCRAVTYCRTGHHVAPSKSVVAAAACAVLALAVVVVLG
jgi:hypothetical protein